LQGDNVTLNAGAELDAMLADLAEQAQSIRDFQCQHGLEHTSTRRLAKRVIRLAEHWRSEVAVRRDTLSNSSVVAMPPRSGLARQASSPPSVDRSNDAGKSSGSDQVRAQAPRTRR
jgi:hypothetical protein